MTRAESARRLALSLGCASAQGADEPPPEPLEAAILFAPVGTLVLPAMAALDRGGRLAIAGIHLSDIPALDYDELPVPGAGDRQRDGEHETATGRSFWRSPPRYPSSATTTEYPFEAADVALEDLARDAVNGAAVIRVRRRVGRHRLRPSGLRPADEPWPLGPAAASSAAPGTGDD